MLITQAFQWVAPFSGWFLLIAPVVAVLAFIISYQVQKRRKVKKDPNSLTVLEGIGVIGIAVSLLGPLFFWAMGSPTHTGLLERDFANQFNINYVSYDYFDGQRVLTGKDPEGKYVICTWENTKSKDTYKVTCDNGKDNWKGPDSAK